MQNGLKRQLHRGESSAKKENAHVKWAEETAAHVKWAEETAAQRDSCLQKGRMHV